VKRPERTLEDLLGARKGYTHEDELRFRLNAIQEIAVSSQSQGMTMIDGHAKIALLVLDLLIKQGIFKEKKDE
jgi:hypothetical protein